MSSKSQKVGYMSFLNSPQKICTDFKKLMLPYKVHVWTEDHNHVLFFELFLGQDKYEGELPIKKLNTPEKLKLEVERYKNCLS